MATITRTVDVSAPAEEVWAAVGGFGTIHEWHPMIDAPELEGADPPHAPGTTRTFARGTAHELTEELIKQDEAGRRSSYAIPNAPWAVRDYTGFLAVHELPGGHSRVEWTVNFEPTNDTVVDELNGALGDGLFNAGLDAIAERFGRV